MRREFRGYKFQIDKDGAWPTAMGSGAFNFTDPECMKAIEEAVEFHRRVFIEGERPSPRPNHAYVYIVAGEIRHLKVEMFKIGSTYNFCERGRNFNWHGLVHIFRCEDRETAFKMESALHRRFVDKRVYGRDWFDLTEDDIDAICADHPVDGDEFERLEEYFGLEQHRPDDAGDTEPAIARG